jgi:predicted metalloprotease with PDZ domain
VLDYTLRMPAPHAHLFEVELRVPDCAGPFDAAMPAWTPGSYLLREFARNVQAFEARDDAGRPLRWTKRDKATWHVEAPAGATTVLRYRVYANELTVRTSHLDATHGYVNGASVFLHVRGREAEPLRVRVETPAGWRTTTALAERADAPDVFLARDYDELVDSPFEIGTHALYEWRIDGVPHRYAIWGRGNVDVERLVRDTTAAVRAGQQIFGALPYSAFTIILHLVAEGRGGLEHRDSTSLQVERWAFAGKEYESTIALVAHEHFHVWNGKRIRPAALGPFDYARENYTRDLWVVEGLTTYYTDVLLLRAGLISSERFLARLAESIGRLRAQPGQRLQPLAESSFDTWIRFYRPDASTPNAQISYYHKGAILGLMLDLMIRTRSGGERSLDDAMRLLWQRWGEPDVGYPEWGEGSARAILEEVYGAPLGDFFARHVDGTDDPAVEPVLAAAGLHLEPDPGTPPTGLAMVEARLGLRLKDVAGRLLVTHVLAGSAGCEAGINAGDEVVAFDGFRARAATLGARVAEAERDRAVPAAVFRRDELLQLEVTPAPQPRAALRLRPLDDAEPTANAVRDAWLAATVPRADEARDLARIA